MKGSAAIAGGLAGASTIASLHEGFRRLTPDAPRMDLLDMEALQKMLKAIHVQVPRRSELLKWTVVGEASSNLVYYSLLGVGGRKNVWLRGTLLGLAAGITAVVLPKPLGLSEAHSNRTPKTKAMTVGLYLIGGLVAAAVSKLVDDVYQEKAALREEVALAGG
jgi:hypothetical protein